jgi:hypothetical protein
LKRALGGRIGLGVLLVVAVAVAAGGIAYAAIPDSNGVIDGCYAKKDGALRVIDTAAGATCDTKKENAIHWDQTGQTGPGATSGTMTVAQDTGDSHLLVSLDNQTYAEGVCTSSKVEVHIFASSGQIQLSGTQYWNTTILPVVVNGESGGWLIQNADQFAGFDVLTNDLGAGVGPIEHLDVNGSHGNPCTFWWMVIPSTS